LGASVAGLILLGGCQYVSAPTSTVTRVRRVGFLYSGTRTNLQPYADAFVNQLRQFGWVERDNLSIEWRFAEGRNELLPELAADLVRLPVEVILAAATVSVVSAHDQTSSIPIVMVNGPAPFRLAALRPELYQSLARPAGNVTGTVGADSEIKSVELLKTVLPRLSHLVYLDDSAAPNHSEFLAQVQQTSQTLGIQTLYQDVQTVEDVRAGFEAARMWSAEAILIYPRPSYSAGVNARVSELAAQAHLPVLYGVASAITDNGGLMSFGQNNLAAYRQGAEYVDKILRGASPSDLPVEEPRQFDFIVNIKAANDIGITFPPDAAAQVTEWVQ
jgi:putative ABC transport system substrate-binding protein